MRILIKHPTTNAETVLCDGPGRGVDVMIGPLDGMAIDDQIATQLAEFLRAAEAKAYNRLNQRTNIAFRVARESASLVAAHAWQLQFHANCLRNGTLHLTETSTNGASTTVKVLNAVITSIRTTPLGVTRLIDFTIVGGKLSV